MRILYLTSGFPFPLTSGFLRHYHFIKHLSDRHEIVLVSLASSSFCQEHLAGMCPFCEEIHVFPRPRHSRWGRMVKAARQLYDAAPEVRQMQTRAVELTQAHGFDVALLSGKDTSAVAKAVAPLPVVVDICDAASARIQRWLPHEKWWKRPWRVLQLFHMRRVEIQLSECAHASVFASQRDRSDLEHFAAPGATKVIPNGVDTEFWQRATTELGEDTVVFTGAMDYAPNTDAAIYLIDRIMPLVRRSHPQARLLIVGRDPPQELRIRHRPGLVEVTGFVDDVRPYLDQSTVYAAPLRFGAGIQNKLLEALAMELPVVTSSLAAAGLQTDSASPPLQIADIEARTADAIVDQLQRAPATKNAAGRAYVQENFDWSRRAEELESQLLECAMPSGTAASDTRAGEEAAAAHCESPSNRISTCLP